VTASRTNDIIVVKERTLEIVHNLEHPDLSIVAGCSKFAVSPDGKYLAIGSTTGALFVFNLFTGEFIKAYADQHQEAIVGVAWASGQPSTLATIDKLGRLYIWN